VIEYWFERFVLSPLIPAAVLLAFAASWSAPTDPQWWFLETLFAFLINVPSAILLLAQFRLWDDLADRERDRREHPERVLSTAEPWFFVTTALALAGVNLWLAYAGRSTQHLLLVVALNVAAICFYHWRPPLRTAASDALLLLKYPAILVVLPVIRLDRVELAIAILLTYGAAIAYETWHDAASPLRFKNS
jgi:hypothetical protein